MAKIAAHAVRDQTGREKKYMRWTPARGAAAAWREKEKIIDSSFAPDIGEFRRDCHFKGSAKQIARRHG
jgi:hypothetical protein